MAKQGFDLAVKRKRLLDRGTIKYRADDRLYRKDIVAINCFHAMAGLDHLFPNGGIFGTGFKMWGFNGTARVLIEYTQKASDKGLLLEPVDVKNDRYGFVYAPTRNGVVPTIRLGTHPLIEGSATRAVRKSAFQPYSLALSFILGPISWCKPRSIQLGDAADRGRSLARRRINYER